MKPIPYLVALLFSFLLLGPIIVSDNKDADEIEEKEKFAAEAAAAAVVYADSLQIVKKENDSLKTLLNQK